MARPCLAEECLLKFSQPIRACSGISPDGGVTKFVRGGRRRLCAFRVRSCPAYTNGHETDTGADTRIAVFGRQKRGGRPAATGGHRDKAIYINDLKRFLTVWGYPPVSGHGIKKSGLCARLTIDTRRIELEIASGLRGWRWSDIIGFLPVFRRPHLEFLSWT